MALEFQDIKAFFKRFILINDSDVVDFVLKDLNEAIPYLPVLRPSSEFGRIEKGAALAIKGRGFNGRRKMGKCCKYL